MADGELSKRASGAQLRKFLMKLVHTQQFSTSVIVLIFVNVGMMMMDGYPVDTSRRELLDLSNAVVTVLFALEMGLKLAAFGLQRYWADSFNRFDGLIVAASLLEIDCSSCRCK